MTSARPIRPHRFTVLLTDEERDLLTKRANAVGIDCSTYLRLKAFGLLNSKDELQEPTK